MTRTPSATGHFLTMFDSAVQDVRHALRLLRRTPAFTITALATLGLGIGLSTAIFSVAYGLLWRALPYPGADRLVIAQSTQGSRTFSTWSPRAYAALQRRVSAFTDLAAYSSIDVQLTGRGEPLELPALDVSPNFFATLGVHPARGRSFLTGSAAAEDDASAIVSDRLWRTWLDADPAFIGKAVTIDGRSRSIVGVLAPDFSFRPVVPGLGALAEADIFLLDRWPGDAGTGAFLSLLGRMAPGVTPARASAELTSLVNDPSIPMAGALAAEGAYAAGIHTEARVVGLQEYGTRSVRVLLLILLGAVSFVLLIACVNVANLQMARLSARRGELSVRMALGAGRRRIVRQLLTEAVVLSLLGAGLGVLLAQLAIHVTLPLVPPFALPRVGGVVIDSRVVMFCLGLSVVSTLLVGLVPALRISGAAFGEGLALQAGQARTTGDRHGEQLRTVLVAAQLAMTLILLVGAGLLLHSFARLTSVPPGFEPIGRDGVLQVVKVTLPERLYSEPRRIHAFAHDVLGEIRHLPGVTSASVINSVPFGMMFIRSDYEFEGEPKGDAGLPKVEAGYFKTMGIPVLAGREFTEADTTGSPKVAIVSEAIVREHFRGGAAEAIGRRVRVWQNNDWLTVVGVVGDIRQSGLNQDVQPMVYAPFQQDGTGFVRFVAFVARTTRPGSVAEGMRATIRRAAPDLPIPDAVTMDAEMAASVAQPRFRTLLLGLFAAAALFIAAGGLYGLMAYAVMQRRREIGVRMALGATRRDVRRLVLGRALRVIAGGVVAGLAGAAAATRVLRAFLFGVTTSDPIAFTLVTLLLMLVGLTAAWWPATRATRIDPSAALRAD